MKYCPNCKRYAQDDEKYCIHCGTLLEDVVMEDGTKKCSYCGTINSSDSKFCDNCGMELNESSRQSETYTSSDSYNDYKYTNYNENVRPKVTYNLGLAFKKFFTGIFDYKGKSNLFEHWIPYLLLSIAVSTITGILSYAELSWTYSIDISSISILQMLGIGGYYQIDIIETILYVGLYLLYIPSTFRRLRDVGKRWYSIFIILIPLIGEFILFIWLIQRSNRYDNL